MKYNQIGNLLIFAVVAFCFCECHREEAKPCAGFKPTTANFEIYHSRLDSGNIMPYDSDTICTRGTGTIRVKALEENARYKWQIGAGIYTLSGFTLNYAGYTDKPSPISLTITKAPNTACAGADTATTKTAIRTVVFTDKSKVFGEYKVKYSYNPDVEVNLKVLYLKNFSYFEDYLALANYPFEGDTSYFKNDGYNLYISFRKIVFLIA